MGGPRRHPPDRRQLLGPEHPELRGLELLRPLHDLPLEALRELPHLRLGLPEPRRHLVERLRHFAELVPPLRGELVVQLEMGHPANAVHECAHRAVHQEVDERAHHDDDRGDPERAEEDHRPPVGVQLAVEVLERHDHVEHSEDRPLRVTGRASLVLVDPDRVDDSEQTVRRLPGGFGRVEEAAGGGDALRDAGLVGDVALDAVLGLPVHHPSDLRGVGGESDQAHGVEDPDAVDSGALTHVVDRRPDRIAPRLAPHHRVRQASLDRVREERGLLVLQPFEDLSLARDRHGDVHRESRRQGEPDDHGQSEAQAASHRSALRLGFRVALLEAKMIPTLRLLSPALRATTSRAWDATNQSGSTISRNRSAS